MLNMQKSSTDEEVVAAILLASLFVANRPGRDRTYDQGIMSLPRGILPAFARYSNYAGNP